MRLVLVAGAVIALIAVLVALGVALSRHRKRVAAEEAYVRRVQSELYIPCLQKLSSELEDDAIPHPCGAGSITVAKNRGDSDLLIKWKPRVPNAVSAKDVKRAVDDVFPNLGKPSVILGRDCGGYAPPRTNPLDSEMSRFASLEMGFDLNAKLYGACMKIGGSRFASWSLGQGTAQTYLSAENIDPSTETHGVAVVLSVSQKAPKAYEWPPASWSDQPVQTIPEETTHLISLREKLLAEKWWYVDARAFLDTATARGFPDDPTTSGAMWLIARLLKTSSDWAIGGLYSIDGCLWPAVVKGINGDFVDYLRLAGIDMAVNVEPISRRLASHGTPDPFAPAKIAAALAGSSAFVYCALVEINEDLQAGLIDWQVFSTRQSHTKDEWDRMVALLRDRELAVTLSVNLDRARESVFRR